MPRRKRLLPPLLGGSGALVMAVVVTLLSGGWTFLVGSAQASASRHAHARRVAHTRSSGGRHKQPGRALKMIWGPPTMPDGTSAFPVYRRLGVRVLEVQLSWADTAPTRPQDPANPADPAYQWPAVLGEEVARAAKYGIQLAIMVKGSPAWSNGGRDQSWAPTAASDYANFMQAASRRYPSVHYWMVWGEVTRPGNFNPMPAGSPEGPERYALILDAAYGALKSVSAANVVIGGMTYTVGTLTAPEFIHWMRLPDGRPPRLDYYGHNPYSARFPNLSENPYTPGVRDINDIDTLERELAVAYPHRTPKLWLSEFSVSSDHANRAFAFYVSRAAQAQWVTAAYKLVDSVRYVAALGWYQLLDEADTSPESLTNGLMTATGTPKPAFYAYAKAP